MLSQVAAAPVVAAVVLAVAMANAPYAAAVGAAPCIRGESESRADSSVDEGEIRWTEATKYDDARKYATGEWNKLRTVSIAPDAANTVNDLEFREYRKADGHPGYWQRRGGVAATDYIYLNTYYLDGDYKDARFRRNVVVHELGHALGLCHKADTVNSVMQTEISLTTVPTAVDRANYRKIWG
ncbi:matrixin family metalloprotease [Streptomyces sp. NPDC048659]|uniref:matrixin family metalloprotease n=1 Tax=Streptomyces sp. NPDC048659 TaxID=3155489 RepID=UPI003437D876